MAGDTSYTPSKPTTTTTVKPPQQQPPPPPNKSNPNLNRHPYRPNPIYHRHNTNRRSYFCIFCFWLILITILILFLATITGCILYLMYRPHRPIFTISSLKISQFNLTTTSDDTSHLSTNFNLTLSTKNTNKKVVFYYDPFAITCVTVDTQIANGSLSDAFASGPNNITIIRSSLYSSAMLLDTTTVNQIRSDLKKKSGLRLKIILDTEARVKIESIKSKKVGIRIECEGIHSLIPKDVTVPAARGKSNRTTAVAPVAVTANVADAKCIVDLRIKIWKWTFSS